MRKTVTLVSVLLLSAIAPAFAQNAPSQAPPTPEEMKKIMDATFGAMVPMMGRMTEVMLEAQLKVAAEPQTAERLASFKKNLYDELIKKGFGKDQALQIVVATGIPSAMPSAK